MLNLPQIKTLTPTSYFYFYYDPVLRIRLQTMRSQANSGVVRVMKMLYNIMPYIHPKFVLFYHKSSTLTLLKSPHGNKRARRQYRKNVRIGLLTIYTHSYFTQGLTKPIFYNALHYILQTLTSDCNCTFKIITL